MKSTSLVQTPSFFGSTDIPNTPRVVRVRGAPRPAAVPSPEILVFLTLTVIDCTHDGPGSVPAI